MDNPLIDLIRDDVKEKLVDENNTLELFVTLEIDASRYPNPSPSSGGKRTKKKRRKRKKNNQSKKKHKKLIKRKRSKKNY